MTFREDRARRKSASILIYYYFSDIVRNERLTTVEEVSEPLSSDFVLDSLPNDCANAARFGSSGTASSDFQADSLPPDFNGERASRGNAENV